MPFKTWDTKADWDAAYRIGAESGRTRSGPQVKLHYHRHVIMPFARNRARIMPALFGWTPPGPTIVILGAAFGWTVEALEALGYISVLGLDPSTYIHAEKGNTEETDTDVAIVAAGLDPAKDEGALLKAEFLTAGKRRRATREVLDESGSTVSSRNTIKAALGLTPGDTVDWAVSEGVLSSLFDAEAQTLSSDAHLYAANVGHLVYTPSPLGGDDPSHNWKTLAQWAALIPADTFGVI